MSFLESADDLIAGKYPAISEHPLVRMIIQQVLRIQDNMVVGLSVAGFFVSSAIGQLLLGWLPSNRHLAAGCAALALGSLAFWITVTLATFPAFVVATLLCGMGQGIVMRTGLTSVAMASPACSRAAVTSALFVVYYLSTSVPIVAIGFGIPAIGISLSVACFASLVTLISIITLGMAWSSRLRRPTPGAAPSVSQHRSEM